MSLILDLPCIISCSAFSAFCLKPWVMKKAVEPTTAPNAISGLVFMAYQTIRVRIKEMTA